MIHNKTLTVLPYYTGIKDLTDALTDRKSIDMLWLEILLNDTIDWESFLYIEQIRIAYEKACVWYSHYSKMIGAYTGRASLEMKTGKIDNREYRKFIEALNLVSS